jgi:hypothetical protein
MFLLCRWMIVRLQGEEVDLVDDKQQIVAGLKMNRPRIPG